MPLHMIKLCVGVESVEDLRAWVETRLQEARDAGRPAEQSHVTRVMPKRAAEILAGGSLFWVIRGHVQVRQRILRFEPVQGADGIQRCRIVLEPVFSATEWQPRRPFQGWRYLKPEEAPADIDGGEEGALALPAHLRRELTALGLL
ncbi:DUF1489 family protein [Aureimonas populi]|uniref:DUF1489 family protein n=1 Tax=Aureimonas populi TaxID=1701758 RepID=A0ABW5CSQ6_9HYPH|nr:DUF1489 domain-containing protein [Aureimonas populi]